MSVSGSSSQISSPAATGSARLLFERCSLRSERTRAEERMEGARGACHSVKEALSTLPLEDGEDRTKQPSGAGT
jgi:hypothetical protein